MYLISGRVFNIADTSIRHSPGRRSSIFKSSYAAMREKERWVEGRGLQSAVGINYRCWDAKIMILVGVK